MVEKANDCPLCDSDEIDIGWTCKLNDEVIGAAVCCKNCDLVVDSPGDEDFVVRLWNQLTSSHTVAL